MEIVFCYYDNVNYEARGAEELTCLSELGHVSFVTHSYPNTIPNNVDPYVTKKKSYLEFVLLGKKVIRDVKPDIVFLHDDYCAIFIQYIKKTLPKCKIVYDMSELRIGGHIKGKHPLITKYLITDQEYEHLREVDLVMAANIERAYIAKGYFRLDDIPLVFDNIHRIDDVVDYEACENKYGHLFENNIFTVIYTGGLVAKKERDICGLIKTFEKLGRDYQLIVAGKTANDPEVDALIEHNAKNVGNINYLGRLTRAELKYLYSKSNINVVLFNLTVINNIYCASGKLYEGFFEGLPVLLSDNPPHVRLCNDYGVGVVSKEGDYSEAIKKLQSDYMTYKTNVKCYMESIDYDNRVHILREEIIKRLQ